MGSKPFTLIRVQITDDMKENEGLIKSLRLLAETARGPSKLSVYHRNTWRRGWYEILVPNVSDHHRAVLDDLGHLVSFRYNKKEAKMLGFVPIRMNNHGTFHKIR